MYGYLQVLTDICYCDFNGWCQHDKKLWQVCVYIFVQHGLFGVLSTSYLLLNVSLFMAQNVLMTQKVKLNIYNVMFPHSFDLWKVIHKTVVAIILISEW
jgi:hypothetical protein